MVNQIDDKVSKSSGYIYLDVPDHIKDQIHSMDGVLYDDLHVTLAFYYNLNGSQVYAIDSVLEDYVEYLEPLKGSLGGIGYFDIGQTLVEWVPVDVPRLISFRAGILRGTRRIANHSEDHGFAPHISRQYIAQVDKITEPFRNIPVEFDTLGFGWHDENGISRSKNYLIGNSL